MPSRSRVRSTTDCGAAGTRTGLRRRQRRVRRRTQSSRRQPSQRARRKAGSGAYGLRPAIRSEPAIARAGVRSSARSRRRTAPISLGGVDGCKNSKGSQRSTTSPAASNASRSSPARNAVSCSVVCRARRTSSTFRSAQTCGFAMFGSLNANLPPATRCAKVFRRHSSRSRWWRMLTPTIASNPRAPRPSPVSTFPTTTSARPPTRSRQRAAVSALSSIATNAQPVSTSRLVNSPVPAPSSRQRTPGPSAAASTRNAARRSARRRPAAPLHPQNRSRSSRTIASPCRRSAAYRRSGSSTPLEGRDLELPEREHRHPEEQQPVPPPADVRLAVDARLVADGHVDDLEPQARTSEEEIEVAEGVEVAEVGARGSDLVVVAPQHDLRAAQRVLHLLPRNGLEESRERAVAEHVEETHRT